MTRMTRIDTDFYGLNLDFCDSPDCLECHDPGSVLTDHDTHINQLRTTGIRSTGLTGTGGHASLLPTLPGVSVLCPELVVGTLIDMIGVIRWTTNPFTSQNLST